MIAVSLHYACWLSAMMFVMRCNLMRTTLLDNIETSGTDFYPIEVLIDNEFRDLTTEKLYSDTVEDLEKFKKLSYETSVALIYFGSDVGFKDRGKKIYNCGSSVTLAGKKIVGANFCRIRLCPMCQKRKSLKTYADFSKILNKLSDYKFLHLVLTVPNVLADELKKTIDDMNKTSSRLFAMKDIKKAFVGIARCLEVSYNDKTKTFHPHFHCLVAVKKSYFTSRLYLKHEYIQHCWSALWCMRHLNMKRMKDDEIIEYDLLDSKRLQVHITKADKGALPEIAKYAVKPLVFDTGSFRDRANVLQNLSEALHGRRMIQTYGVIKDTAKNLKIDLNSDVVELDTLDGMHTRTYNFNYRLMQYEEVKTN